MESVGLPRRSFIECLVAAPLGAMAPTQSATVMKAAAQAGRANDVIKLPGGDLVYVKVASAETGGALFMTEQPIERRGSGPPKHYHEEQDEWFYCLYDGTGPGRILIGFTPAARIEQFFRDLERRGEYFGNGSAADRDTAHRMYGIVNVGPPLRL